MSGMTRDARSGVLEAPAACFSYGCQEVEALLQTLGQKLKLSNKAQHRVVRACNQSIAAVLAPPWQSARLFPTDSPPTATIAKDSLPNAPIAENSATSAPAANVGLPSALPKIPAPADSQHWSSCPPLISTSFPPSLPAPEACLAPLNISISSASEARLSVRIRLKGCQHHHSRSPQHDAEEFRADPPGAHADMANKTGDAHPNCGKGGGNQGGVDFGVAAAPVPGVAGSAPATSASTSGNPGAGPIPRGLGAAKGMPKGDLKENLQEVSDAAQWACRRALLVLLTSDGIPVRSESRCWRDREGATVVVEAQVPLTVLHPSGNGFDHSTCWAAVWLDLTTHSTMNHPGGRCTLLLPLDECPDPCLSPPVEGKGRDEPSWAAAQPPAGRTGQNTTLLSATEPPRPTVSSEGEVVVRGAPLGKAGSSDRRAGQGRGVGQAKGRESAGEHRESARKESERRRSAGWQGELFLEEGRWGDGSDGSRSEVLVQTANSSLWAGKGPDLTLLAAWMAACPEFEQADGTGSSSGSSAMATPCFHWLPSSSSRPCGWVKIKGCSPGTAEIVLQSPNDTSRAALQRAVEHLLRQHSQGAELFLEPNSLSLESLHRCQCKLNAMAEALEASISCLESWVEHEEPPTGAGPVEVEMLDGDAEPHDAVLMAKLSLDNMQSLLQMNYMLADLLT